MTATDQFAAFVRFMTPPEIPGDATASLSDAEKRENVTMQDAGLQCLTSLGDGSDGIPHRGGKGKGQEKEREKRRRGHNADGASPASPDADPPAAATWRGVSPEQAEANFVARWGMSSKEWWTECYAVEVGAARPGWGEDRAFHPQ